MNGLLPALLILMGFSVAFILFRRAKRKRDELLPEEKGQNLLYEEIGGGQFDWSNTSPPYVKLRLYDDFLVISSLEKILLRYEDIDSVQMDRSGAVRIFHHDPNQPKKIFFGSESPERSYCSDQCSAFE
jgi:hypothetical protein